MKCLITNISLSTNDIEIYITLKFSETYIMIYHLKIVTCIDSNLTVLFITDFKSNL